MLKKTVLATALCLLTATAPSQAMTSHLGWPEHTGMLLMNKHDSSRPLNGQPGADPFDGADKTYSCDEEHQNTQCIEGGPAFAPAELICEVSRPSLPGLARQLVSHLCAEEETISKVPVDIGHNELLGGHGSDTIHAGPRGDVLWGDYKPSGQPTTQYDRMYGGPGKDFIYASHGHNEIHTGGGADVIHAHFGYGSITCDSKDATLFISRKSRKRYAIHGCRRISYKTLGY